MLRYLTDWWGKQSKPHKQRTSMRRSYIMRIRIGPAFRTILRGRTFRGGTVLYRDGTFVLERNIAAENRRHAVTIALNWLWVHFGEELGQAQTLLTVDNPYDEVRYSASFHCRAREYCYLDDETISRLLKESRGELLRETRVRSPYHPHGSVRRVKRRRKLPFRVAPCVYADANNTFYYRYTYVPQHSRDGRFFRRRKIRLFRLEARTLSAAYKEIQDRRLAELHKSHRRLTIRDAYPAIVSLR